MEDVRKLAALMITDMVGYTRLSQRDEARALRLLSEHNVLIRESVTDHGGREVKHTGDGFLVEFPSALQAVSCSIDIQRLFHDRNEKVEDANRFQIRIGLHVGDVVHRDGDVFGDGVNITSRIEPLSLPGGICLSQSVQAQVWNKIDRPLQSLGSRELKNVEIQTEIFRVVLPWEEKQQVERQERSKKLDRTRLAVLPLVNISQDPDDVYFADGMTEELIYTLSRTKGLRVIAQTSAMAYKGTSKTIREIGTELRVGSILEGSVRKSGDRVRITTQLIDVQTEEHLWAERYDRQLADVFEIQSEISEEVGKGLKTLLKKTKKAKPVERPTEKFAAYTEYLKGRHSWNRRTKTGLTQALEHFKRAVQIDPNFAKAHSGIADCHTVLANQGHVMNEIALPKAKEAAKRALDLDPSLAEAHASLGIAYLQFKSDARAAEKEFKEAIRLNPSYATARQWYSGALHAQMRYEEALEHAQTAIGLDPMAHIMHINIASILSKLGRHEDAREHVRRAIELEPDYEASYADLARIDMTLWNWRGAKNVLSGALERNPRNTEALSCKASLYAVLGKTEKALEIIREAAEIAPDSRLVKDQMAQILRIDGRSDEAIVIFEQLNERKNAKPWSLPLLCFTYIQVGRLEDARRALKDDEGKNKGLYPAMDLWYSALSAMVEAASGSRDEEALSYLKQVSGHDETSELHTLQAMIFFLLGDADRAYEHLDQAMAFHEPLLVDFPVDPLFASQRADPRFQQMLEVMGRAKVAKPV